MKLVLFFIPFFWFQFSLGQHYYLKINGASENENLVIDSLGFEPKHATVALLLEEQKRFENLLINKGYFDKVLLEQKKINDSSFVFRYKLGNAIKKKHYIYRCAFSRRKIAVANRKGHLSYGYE